LKIFSRVKELAKEQLTQGVQAERLALGLSLAIGIGIFPLLGFSTLACLALGAMLKLNQPFLQAVNYLMAPLQLLLMPIFLRVGEWIFSRAPLPFSPVEMGKHFFSSPGDFLAKYGQAGLFAVFAWALMAPLFCWFVYLLARSRFSVIAKRMQRNKV